LIQSSSYIMLMLTEFFLFGLLSTPVCGSPQGIKMTEHLPCLWEELLTQLLVRIELFSAITNLLIVPI